MDKLKETLDKLKKASESCAKQAELSKVCGYGVFRTSWEVQNCELMIKSPH